MRNKKSFIYVKKNNVFDITGPFRQKRYDNMRGKARKMRVDETEFWDWFLSKKYSAGIDRLCFTSEEVIDLSPYIQSNKVTQQDILTLKMLFPNENWDEAFLKRDML